MRGQSHVVAEFPIEHREHVLDLRRVGVADGVRDGELVGAGREELLREAQDGGRIDLAFDGAAEGCREPGEQADAATRLARFFVAQRHDLLEVLDRFRRRAPDIGERSEEHTSELQSLMRISYAVFCLKKKKKITTTHAYITCQETNT